LIITGSALLLFSPDQQSVHLVVIALGLLAAAISVKLSSARATITRYRKEPWRIGDLVILLTSTLLVFLAFAGVFAR
jgi:hypothetical protein